MEDVLLASCVQTCKGGRSQWSKDWRRLELQRLEWAGGPWGSHSLRPPAPAAIRLQAAGFGSGSQTRVPSAGGSPGLPGLGGVGTAQSPQPWEGGRDSLPRRAPGTPPAGRGGNQMLPVAAAGADKARRFLRHRERGRTRGPGGVPVVLCPAPRGRPRPPFC